MIAIAAIYAIVALLVFFCNTEDFTPSFGRALMWPLIVIIYAFKGSYAAIKEAFKS
jgi:hypothetical protein